VAKAKKQNYLHGAAILTAGVIIMKILGAIYKIPIGNLLGDDGYALFLSAYNVFSVFLMLATAGLPVALSRMISAANTQGRPMQVRRTFSVASWTFFALGALSTSIMFLFPNWLAADVLHNPDSALCIRVLAPSVLIVCFTSSYRGYAQGHENMIPTTIGEVLEVLFKVIAGLIISTVVIKSGLGRPKGSAGAMLGVTVGSIVSLAYMIWYKRTHYAELSASYTGGVSPTDTPDDDDKVDSAATIVKNILSIGAPIAFGACILAILNSVDSKLCMNRLQTAAGFTYKQAKILYGVYGKAQNFFNLPAALITPLTISIVPAISGAISVGKRKTAAKISEDSMRIAAVISMPMGIGLAVMSAPIMQVFYPGSHEAGPALLAIMGVASIFVCLLLLENAVLQSSGKEKYTMVTLITGGVVKIAVNWVLVANPKINIYGAPIGTLVSYIVMVTMDFLFMSKLLLRSPRISRIVFKPGIASLVMGAGAWAVYGLLSKLLGSGRLMMFVSMCVSIVIAVVIYVVLTLVLKTISAEDLELIPGGKKIAKILKMS